MKHLLLFVVIVGAAIWIQRSFFSSSETAFQEQVAEAPSALVETPKALPTPKPESPPPNAPKPTNPSAQVAPETPAPNSDGPVYMKGAVHRPPFFINEALVTELENEGNNIRELGNTESEPLGWRIWLRRHDTIFAKMGVYSGDLIRYEQLEKVVQNNPNDTQLIERFKRVLEDMLN
ncbi:MAG: hypothetical protein AB7F59_09105 [Bdellovibrionales bacterium]